MANSRQSDAHSLWFFATDSLIIRKRRLTPHFATFSSPANQILRPALGCICGGLAFQWITYPQLLVARQNSAGYCSGRKFVSRTNNEDCTGGCDGYGYHYSYWLINYHHARHSGDCSPFLTSLMAEASWFTMQCLASDSRKETSEVNSSLIDKRVCGG